jgi:hypothetical protein
MTSAEMILRRQVRDSISILRGELTAQQRRTLLGQTHSDPEAAWKGLNTIMRRRKRHEAHSDALGRSQNEEEQPVDTL